MIKNEESNNELQILTGKIIFKMTDVNSKNEHSAPFLQSKGGELIPLFLVNSNPFENSVLKSFENQNLSLEGSYFGDVFQISKIESCSASQE